MNKIYLARKENKNSKWHLTELVQDQKSLTFKRVSLCEQSAIRYLDFFTFSGYEELKSKNRVCKYCLYAQKHGREQMKKMRNKIIANKS